MGNTMQDEVFMKKAIELSKLAVEHGNEPFGAVLVKDGKAVFCNENQMEDLFPLCPKNFAHASIH